MSPNQPKTDRLSDHAETKNRPGDESHRNVPTVMVVFGATGDLMSKKIVPALYHLFLADELPRQLRFLGFARRDLSDRAFQKRIADILAQHGVRPSRRMRSFLELFSYVRGDFDEVADYHTLARSLGHIDGEWRACSNKLLYLAVPPDYYETIFNHLAVSGLNVPCGTDQEGWTRVIVEKPFGSNQETAKQLDKQLAALFQEEQIFRIDHYLAKEMLQNILTFRFSNNLFEDSWDSRSIEKIEIRYWETLGVEGRGAFYDGVGALRDVGQNHHLQTLALLTMDHPQRLEAAAIRQQRAMILEKLRIIDSSAMSAQTYRAQYAGYRTIEGVEPNSQRETFFRIQAELDTARWRGTPIILEGGKRLAEQRKEVTVTLRHPSPCLCPPGGPHQQNQVIFSLEPEERITIRFWSKKPGLRFAVEERNFDFLLRDQHRRHQYVEEYEKLLLDCLLGDQVLFVSTQEIQAMWHFIDPIVSAWQSNRVPLATYPAGTYPKIIEPKQVATTLTHEIGIVGLGKMGGALAEQLLEKGWRVIGYNRSPQATALLVPKGLIAADSPANLLDQFTSQPRIIWLMIPAGPMIDDLLFGKAGLARQLKAGDIIIDGGNSFYKDSRRRAQRLARIGIEFLDVGTSGGPTGARRGASLMIGGKQRVFKRLEPLFAAVSVRDGYQFFSGAGAGHFVKMIHNGIEYGMMQSIAEGFEILAASDYQLDVSRVADVYNHGSVIESRLIGWLRDAFRLHGPELKKVTSTVAHTGEGAWTVETAQELGIQARIIAGALAFRKQSARDPRFAGRILSAIREQFGGHSITEPPGL